MEESPGSVETDDGTVVGRAFRVLGAFHDEMVVGVREIARRTTLPVATVHRIVGQLVELEVLSRAGTRYRLGARIFEIGAQHYPMKLRNAINPFLVDLQRATAADVATVELVGTYVVVVDHVPSRTDPCPGVSLGARLPAHATAGGKVIMAFTSTLPYDEGDNELWRVTPRTIVDRTQLETELGSVRSAGVAYERGECDPATQAVAAALLNRHGRVLGALVLASTSPRFVPEDCAVAVSALSRTLTRVGARTNIPFYAQLTPDSPPQPVHPGTRPARISSPRGNANF
jgi:DNA-binding IclR family transcriptional regulator